MFKSDTNMYSGETFLYFAYGSNLFKKWIHTYNPSAEFVTIGRLDNNRLDFIKYSKFWGGPGVTMVPTANAHIWGAVWKLHKDDLISLDDQNGVDERIYYPLRVQILTPYMGTLACRAYEQKINPLPRGDNDPIPVEQWPSKTYKKILLFGAIECGLPEYYIKSLKALKDNGEEGCYRMVQLLRRYGSEEPCECAVPGRIPRRPLKIELKKKKTDEE